VPAVRRAAASGAQHVQAHPRDDRGEPSAEVLGVAGASAADPQPGFLHGVVRLAQRAEHPVGHRPQLGPVLLEAPGQPFSLVVHRVTVLRHVVS